MLPQERALSAADAWRRAMGSVPTPGHALVLAQTVALEVPLGVMDGRLHKRAGTARRLLGEGLEAVAVVFGLTQRGEIRQGAG